MGFPSFRIQPLGDAALLVHFGDAIDGELNEAVLALFHRIRALDLPGLLDVVPAYGSLAVYYDVYTVRQFSPGGVTAYETVAGHILQMHAEPAVAADGAIRKLTVPVCYSLKFAPDLALVAGQKGITPQEVVRLHTARIYRVYMIGFLPGFAYMGEVDERIAVPRHAQPRRQVDAGCVGIAGRQTGIYPLASPGGWQIVGRTPLKLFDPAREVPSLFRPGDEVQFYSIEEDEFENYQSGHP
ncbi:5-oxoprolinase subunit PxpB [Paraflavisolibacter sp. H34]|uniref:5-oxoprolinase subunit PxpB n=1 Tax=Huijunlia imazamoxiresistens TaxID=3127457 RepID=UPI00301775E2